MTTRDLFPRGARFLTGLLLGIVLLTGCIQSPTYPTPETDEPDGPDDGGPSAVLPPAGLTFFS